MPTNALNKIFMSLYGEVDREDYLASLERNLVKKKGMQRFPANKEIKAILKDKDMYNIKSKNKIYFLELLENYKNREHVPVFDNKDITIEHVFPRNPDAKWKEELDESEYGMFKETYLNTIGNLTLSGNNGSLSNKSFTEKQNMNVDEKEQGYAYSRLWLNSQLKNIEEWNIFELGKRYDIIIERFFKVWEYPKVDILFGDDQEEVNIFEAETPKHKKLAYFIFKDERVMTNKVAKMYYHVIEHLFEENPKLFLTTDLKEYLPITTDQAEVRKPHAIAENYFVEANLDNAGKFRRLKRLLNVFGYEDELIVRYENL